MKENLAYIALLCTGIVMLVYGAWVLVNIKEDREREKEVIAFCREAIKHDISVPKCHKREAD